MLNSCICIVVAYHTTDIACAQNLSERRCELAASSNRSLRNQHDLLRIVKLDFPTSGINWLKQNCFQRLCVSVFYHAGTDFLVVFITLVTTRLIFRTSKCFWFNSCNDTVAFLLKAYTDTSSNWSFKYDIDAEAFIPNLLKCSNFVTINTVFLCFF